MPSTLHHDPLSGSEALSHTNLNAIFAALDAANVDLSMTVTAGEALSENDFVYLDESTGTWFKLDTDATGGVKIGRLRGVVTEDGGIASSGTGTVVMGGLVSGFTGLTAWSWVFGSTTAGGYTQTEPSPSDGGGQIAIVPMGLAVSTTQVLVLIQPVLYVERETLADDAELTIQHHSNAQTRTRDVFAYVGGSYDESLLIGSISGNSEEVGCEFGSGSGSDQDTMTTFRNMTGGSADITYIVRIW